MKNRRNYYRILHVQPDAPAEVIRASYRTLMRELKKHPDLGGSGSEASLINEAYAVLGNPEARARYDKVLSAGYTMDGDACLQAQKSTGLKNESKRTLPRVKRADRISYYADSSPAKVLQGRMVDFSLNGMRFLSSERLPRGSRLKISGPFFDASAQVSNVRQKEIEGRTFFEVGVVFVAINLRQLSGTFLSTSA